MPLLAPLGFLLAFMLTIAVVLTNLKLAIQTTTMKNTLSDAYKAAALYGSLHTTSFNVATGTNEITGGSPAYARKSLSWGASAAGVVSTSATVFDVGSGVTVIGAGIWSAVTAGTYLDGANVTSQAFASQGTYSVTYTYTQT